MTPLLPPAPPPPPDVPWGTRHLLERVQFGHTATETDLPHGKLELKKEREGKGGDNTIETAGAVMVSRVMGSFMDTSSRAGLRR